MFMLNSIYHCLKVFGPLKGCVSKILGNLGHASSSAFVGNHKFPAIIKHTMDQATPASIKRAFEVTGLVPFNRSAINTTQLIEPTFTTKEKPDGAFNVELHVLDHRLKIYLFNSNLCFETVSISFSNNSVTLYLSLFCYQE